MCEFAAAQEFLGEEVGHALGPQYPSETCRRDGGDSRVDGRSPLASQEKDDDKDTWVDLEGSRKANEDPLGIATNQQTVESDEQEKESPGLAPTEIFQHRGK